MLAILRYKYRLEHGLGLYVLLCNVPYFIPTMSMSGIDNAQELGGSIVLFPKLINGSECCCLIYSESVISQTSNIAIYRFSCYDLQYIDLAATTCNILI